MPLILFILLSLSCHGQENCNNGIDDDGDGKIDLNDPDCVCDHATVVSMLPNPSFETYSSCPTDYSELNLATPWYQATNATTDYFNKCSSFTLPVITTLGLEDFPDGNGIVGALYRHNWKEYIGLNLSAPLIAGTDYQLTFQIAGLTMTMAGDPTPYDIAAYEPVNIALFGKLQPVSFPVLTVVSPNSINSSWSEVGTVKYVPSSNWNEITMLFTPNTNLNSIMIGPPTTLPLSYNAYGIFVEVLPYFLYDNLVLSQASNFKVNITQTGSFCDNNLVLQANLTDSFPTSITYQWYKDNIAIVGAINPTYNVLFSLLNMGNYCVKITDGNQCYVSNRLNIQNITTAPDIVVVQPYCTILTGSIEVTTSAAEYSFDGGTTWQTNSISGPLAPLRYFVKTKSASGCISESIAVDLAPALLPVAPWYTTIEPHCTSSEGTGISITITSTGSMFSFDDGVTWTTNNTAYNLVADTVYKIKYKDIYGCISNTSWVQLYPQYLIDAPLFSIQQPSTCFNNFGIITISTSAAVYSFDNGNTWSTNPISPPLSPGTYMVRIKEDVESCQSLPSLVIINAAFDAPTPPTYTVVQPTSCANPFGIISITNTASQYSFDNGLTWSTNSTSEILPVGTYLLKLKNSTDCESSSISVTILSPTDYPSTPDFTLFQPDCSNPNGSIMINTVASNYSVDNGISWSNSNFFGNLIPNTYQLQIKNALDCTSQISDAIVIPFADFTVLPNAISPQVFCFQENATLNSMIVNGQNIRWYDNQSGGNLLSNTTILIDGETYYATQTIDDCESLRTPVLINIQDTPAPSGSAEQSFCNTENATLSSISIMGNTIIWYDSVDGNIELSSNTILENNFTYYASQTILGCESTLRLAVTITLTNTLNANDYSETICDDLNDGVENIDLATYNSSFLAPSTNIFKYYNTLNGAQNLVSADQIQNTNNHTITVGNNYIYVRIESANTCFQVVTLTLNLVSKPIIPIEENTALCEGQSVTLNAGSSYNSYLWSTGQTSQKIIISQGGSYSVTVSKNYGSLVCSTTKNFTVINSNIATIKDIIITDWTQSDNTITVLLTSGSVGDYEYSLNGIDFQDDNVFSNLEAGEHIVFVRDKNNCGITSEKLFLLMYPKFFTPNQDGFNDYWRIKFSNYEPSLIVTIFDRYGKILKILSFKDIGWDGTYLGKQLPSTDYWFVVKRQNGKEHRGHFTLKR